jgi:integrase
MGRAKKTAVIGKLRLKYPKTGFDSSKSYTIYYEYNYNRSIIRKAAPFKARVRDWNQGANAGKGGLRSSYGEDYIRDTNRMLHHLSNMDDRIREYSEKHPGKLNEEIIRSLLHDAPLTRDDEGRDFIQFVEESLKNRLNANQIKYSRYQNGLSGLKVFREFLRARGKGTYKPDSIYLGEITGDLIDEYIEYRKDVKENVNATINHSLTPIIIACRMAAMKHYIPEEIYNEIREKRVVVDASSIDDDRVDDKYLNRAQIKQLVEFYNTDTETRRKEYIEMFLFAFHAGGLRLIDVMTLQWKNIDFVKKELKKVLIKSLKYQKQRNTVPLTPPAIQILTKWKAMGRRERFVFDLLDDEFDLNDAAAIYLARNNADRKVNQALNVIGRKLKLPFTLSFHCARHSFAINALNDEKHPLDMYQVSRLLGHTSTEVTERVYADYIRETLHGKVNALSFDFLPNLESHQEK